MTPRLAGRGTPCGCSGHQQTSRCAAAAVACRQFDLTDTILAGSEEVVRAGVVRKYAKADGGAPVTFTCPATAYPVVFEASRIVWKCTQTLSAFMRFPCNGKPPMGTSSCSVDYNATW